MGGRKLRLGQARLLPIRRAVLVADKGPGAGRAAPDRFNSSRSSGDQGKTWNHPCGGESCCAQRRGDGASGCPSRALKGFTSAIRALTIRWAKGG